MGINIGLSIRLTCMPKGTFYRNLSHCPGHLIVYLLSKLLILTRNMLGRLACAFVVCGFFSYGLSKASYRI